jgi:hypothetical protein
MIVVNKKQMGDSLYIQNKAEEFGLVKMYVYHCYRCNYTWLPRDFDLLPLVGVMKSGKTDGFSGHDLFYREPPKCCARCKSRSWKEPQSRRKKKNSDVKTFIENELKFVKAHPSLLDHAWIDSVARLRALHRQNKLTAKDIIGL